MVPWREPEVSKLQNSNRQTSAGFRTIRFYGSSEHKCKSDESERKREGRERERRDEE